MNRNPNMNRQPNGSMMSPQQRGMNGQMNNQMRNSMPPNMQQQALRQMQQQSMSMRNTMPPQNINNRQPNPSMMNQQQQQQQMRNANMNSNMNLPNMNRNNSNGNKQGPQHRKDNKTKIFGQDPSVPAPPQPGGPGGPQMNKRNSNKRNSNNTQNMPGMQPGMSNRSSGHKIQINGPQKNNHNRLHADSVDSMNNTENDDIYGNYSQRNTIASKSTGPQPGGPGPNLHKAQSFQPGMNRPGMGLLYILFIYIYIISCTQ